MSHLLYLTDRNGNNPQRVLTIVDLTALESLIGGKATSAELTQLASATDAKFDRVDDRITALEPKPGDIVIKHVDAVDDATETIIGHINGPNFTQS